MKIRERLVAVSKYTGKDYWKYGREVLIDEAPNRILYHDIGGSQQMFAGDYARDELLDVS